jgi:Tol biopolymer transport system component
MTARDDFNRTVSDWLDEEAGRGTPDYLDAVLAQTTRTRQRPAWSSLERWLPMAITFRARVAPMPRPLWILALLAVLALTAALFVFAGVGKRPLPHFGAAANGGIAFVDGGNLNVAGPDGLTIRSLISLPAGATAMSYSPDGTRLVYRTDEQAPSIIVMNADGTNATTVATGASVTADGPIAWSPDSRRLAYTGLLGGGADIVIVNVDGSRLAPLGQAAGLQLRERSYPAWSPDGQWISFFTPEADGYVGLYVVHPDGTGEQRLSTSPINPDILEMSWAPDPAQRRLAYVSGGFVKMFDLATAKETSVGTGFWATWSSDASRISWLSGGTQVARVDDILAGNARSIHPFPQWTGYCQEHPELAGKAICSPAQWSPDSVWVYGPDIAGKSIVLATVDGSQPSRTIALDHPINVADISGWQVAWQPVAP